MRCAMVLPANLLGWLCLLMQFSSLSDPQNNTGAKTHTVEIVAMKFKPAQLLVNQDDKVVFVNRDMVAHNATEISGKQWRSATLKKDEAWSLTVVRSADYYCTFHPVMKGKITVKP